MEEQSALLRSLKIDRDALPGDRPGWRRHLPIVLVVALLLGAVLWWFGTGRTPPVETVKPSVETGADLAARSVLDASGYVVARRQATVSSKLTGKVVELLIEEGSRVEQDQILARIDDTNVRAQMELTQAQAEAARAQLAEVRVQLGEAERQLRRTRELADRQLLSASALDSAQATADGLRARQLSLQRSVTVAERNVDVQRQQLEDTVVRAPFAGVVTVKNAQPGEMISPLSAGGDGTRTGIGTVVDMGSLEVEVDVNENFINRVHPGQPARTTLNAYPDAPIASEVIAVIPTADRSKATVKVRIALRELDDRVLPEMGARVSFLAEEAPATDARRIWIPRAALQQKDDQAWVLRLDDTRIRQQTVEAGEERNDQVEILSGLNGDETLVSGDWPDLRDGDRVRLQP